jgi:hypothetical protein
MGHWVTLDDDQHVYISDGGKVLATRSAISSAGGGKQRGKALAARSKAAIGKATGRSKLSEQALKGRGLILRRKSKEAMEKAAGRAHSQEEDRRFQERKAETRKQFDKGLREQDTKKPEPVARAKPSGEQAWLERRAAAKAARQSPATTRAIEHAKAAGPSLREQADKARAAKGDREARTAAILAKAKKFHRKTMSTAYQSREAANRAQPRLERLANRTAGVAQANKEERIKQQKARWSSY